MVSFRVLYLTLQDTTYDGKGVQLSQCLNFTIHFNHNSLVHTSIWRWWKWFTVNNEPSDVTMCLFTTLVSGYHFPCHIVVMTMQLSNWERERERENEKTHYLSLFMPKRMLDHSRLQEELQITVSIYRWPDQVAWLIRFFTLWPSTLVQIRTWTCITSTFYFTKLCSFFIHSLFTLTLFACASSYIKAFRVL